MVVPAACTSTSYIQAEAQLTNLPCHSMASEVGCDGTWLVVEPMAGDTVQDNLNPVGRAFYGFSTLLCTPASLSQEVGLALGTQAGPAKIRDVATAAGFSRFQVATNTPFNNVLEVRP